MRIESGTTKDRQVRLGLFFVMCLGMSGWFAYDGFLSYPAKNLDWAREKVPGRDLTSNPRVIQQNLVQVSAGTTADQLVSLLGEPAVQEPKRLRYVGERLVATVHLDDEDRVTKVESLDRAAGQLVPEASNPLVTPPRVERIEPGMEVSRVKVDFGEPSATLPKTWWYIGPASYAAFPLENGTVTGEMDIQVNSERTESDIYLQKVIAGLLALGALFALYKVIGAVTMKYIVDEEGLMINRKRIPFEAMTRLITDDYTAKAWLDLEYEEGGSTRQVRLDSYHIADFAPMLEAICERKSWPVPQRRKAGAEGGFPVESADEPADSAGPTKDTAQPRDNGDLSR